MKIPKNPLLKSAQIVDKCLEKFMHNVWIKPLSYPHLFINPIRGIMRKKQNYILGPGFGECPTGSKKIMFTMLSPEKSMEN